jgi:hypothetical protein
MSIRFSGDKQALRRTANLPTSHAAFTILGFAKLANAQAGNSSKIVYTQDPGGFNAETLQVDGGTALRVVDSWGSNPSTDIATLAAGGASGVGWFGFALVGTAAGASGLKGAHKPVSSGTYTTRTVTNSPGAAGFEALQFGDSPVAGANWFDGLIAHLKIYDRALSDAEIQAEFAQGAPASSTGLISYHSFSDPTLATALIPDSGAGAFTIPTNNPSTSTDNPVFAAPPTLTGDDVMTDTAVDGAGVIGGLASGALLTAIRLIGSASVSGVAANTIATQLKLAAPAGAQLASSATLSTQIRIGGASSSALSAVANPTFAPRIFINGLASISGSVAAALLRQPFLAGVTAGSLSAALAPLSKPLPLAGNVIVTAVTTAAAFVAPTAGAADSSRDIGIRSQRTREITFTAR